MNQTIPTTIDQVEFDFEDYALTHGIPDTIDPLPYRKAGSVFGTGDDAEPQVTSAKNDPRLRTVVCRHWLRDLCMKGAACEFLHQYDYREEMVADLMARIVPRERRDQVYLAVEKELAKAGVPASNAKRKGDIEHLEKFDKTLRFKQEL